MFYKSLVILIGLSVTLCASLKTDVTKLANKKYHQSKFDSYIYYNCFKKASKKTNIPIHILLGIAKGESNFNAKAVSKANAVGVMQILWPGTAKDLGFKKRSQLYDACRNIQAGSKYFRYLLKRYDGSYYYALAAYNYGPGRIKKNQTIPNGAKWYVSYIYEKTLLIVNKDYKYERVYKYFTFDSYHRAKMTMNHLNSILKQKIPLEIFKTSDSYKIQFSYKTYKQKIQFIKHIKDKTGMEAFHK